MILTWSKLVLKLKDIPCQIPKTCHPQTIPSLKGTASWHLKMDSAGNKRTRTFPFGMAYSQGQTVGFKGWIQKQNPNIHFEGNHGNHSWNSTRQTSEKWNNEASSVMILSCPWIRLLEFNSFPWTMPNSRHPNLLSVVLKVGAAKFHITTQ